MSRVLKSGVAESGDGPAPQELLYDARLAAERVIADARLEADRIRAQAAAEGRERGFAAVTELLVHARAVAARARSTSESELRVLAVRVAEHILGRELAQAPEQVTDLVARALDSAGAARQVLVRCHPDDLAALERGRPRLLARLSRAQAVTLRADALVARGGCIVETELATIDARLATQLDAIERALRGEEPG